LHDGIEFERAGRPAAPILTEPFVGTAETAARMAGLAGYPFVVIPHPISRLTREQLRVVAEGAAPEVYARLVSGIS